MDQEIAYASQAGLNYWAFVDYLDEAPVMSIALNRFIEATDKNGLRYCLIEKGSRLDKTATKVLSTGGVWIGKSKIQREDLTTTPIRAMAAV